MKALLKKIILLPLLPFWPVVFLLQPRARTVEVLRRVLYIFCVLGVFSSFFAGLFVLSRISAETDLLRDLFKDSEAGMIATVGASMIPFLFLAVLQGSAAFRVLRHVPNQLLHEVPGLSGMNSLARVLYALLAVSLVVACVNLGALGLLVLGGLLAFIITLLYGILYLMLVIVTLGAVLLAGDTGFWDTVQQIWSFATFARHLFTWEEQALNYLNIDPNWAALVAIVIGYGVPTLLAIWVWVNRRRFIPAAA